MPLMLKENTYQAFSWQNLYQAGYSFKKPFKLSLLNQDIIYAEKILRILPKKRMVIAGKWQDKSIVAKLFFNPERCKQHMEKDLAGIQALQANNIPTPSLLYHGISDDRRVYIIILEQISEAENLAPVWENKKNHANEIIPILETITTELATQHVLGVLQQDIHLKNFLFTENKIYTLDGGQIKTFPPLLAKDISINNLALFLAQLGVGFENYKIHLLKHYAKLRGWRLKPEDYKELFFQINKCNNKRWQQFEKKIFRNCTDFSKFRFSHLTGMYNRSYHSNEFLALLKNPDEIFNHPATNILKAGRSATVALINIDGQKLVIKRYNIKNFWHRFRRALRLTRAHSSWRLAQKFLLLGIDTAKPVAFIENKFFGFRGKSYFISEYVSNQNVGDFLHEASSEDERNSMISHVCDLLKNLVKLEITHGDLKITNLLINPHNFPVLIDLDGATEHLTFSSLQKSFNKDINRFLKNFQQSEILKLKFLEIFKKNIGSSLS